MQDHNTPVPTLPAPEASENPANSTNALGHLIFVTRKRAIVAVGAFALIALFLIAPTAATGLVFGAGLFGVNSLIDSKMGDKQ